MKQMFLTILIAMSAHTALAQDSTQAAQEAFSSTPEIQSKLAEYERDGWILEGPVSQTVLRSSPGSGSMVPSRRIERLQQNLVRGTEKTFVSAVFHNTIYAAYKWRFDYKFLFFSKTPEDSNFLATGGTTYWGYDSLSNYEIEKVKSGFLNLGGYYCSPFVAKSLDEPQVKWEKIVDADGRQYVDVEVSGNFVCEK